MDGPAPSNNNVSADYPVLLSNGFVASSSPRSQLTKSRRIYSREDNTTQRGKSQPSKTGYSSTQGKGRDGHPEYIQGSPVPFRPHDLSGNEEFETKEGPTMQQSKPFYNQELLHDSLIDVNKIYQ